MTGFNLVSVQNTILSYLQTQFSDYEIYEDYLISEQELQRVNKQVKPYIVIAWHGLDRLGSNAAISGVRQDEYESGFDIGVIAPTPKQCRYAINIIIDNLIGYSFDGTAYLTPGQSSSPFVAAARDGVPHLYMAMSEFSFPMNYDNPGQAMTPP
tara:strand:+ start:1023 stop:1484 length:462 start_codon:yes stop_codon:yes gene_type:complete